VVCDLSVDEDESYCIGGHYVHNCRSILLPILFNEQPEWNTERAPEGAEPLEGFGKADPALLPRNVTPEELFGGTA